MTTAAVSGLAALVVVVVVLFACSQSGSVKDMAEIVSLHASLDASSGPRPNFPWRLSLLNEYFIQRLFSHVLLMTFILLFFKFPPYPLSSQGLRYSVL